MLILTRRIGESLVIGDDVTLTILGVKGGQVRIGINAPITVSIHREEIYKKIQHEQINTKDGVHTKDQINTAIKHHHNPNNVNGYTHHHSNSNANLTKHPSYKKAFNLEHNSSVPANAKIKIQHNRDAYIKNELSEEDEDSIGNT